MSTVVVANFSDGTISVPADALTEGTAKTWVVANGAASVSNSYNISSGTDSGTGDYEYTPTNALASQLEPAAGGVRRASSASARTGNTTVISTLKLGVNIFLTADGVTADDQDNHSLAMGDLA